MKPTRASVLAAAEMAEVTHYMQTGNRQAARVRRLLLIMSYDVEPWPAWPPRPGKGEIK